MEKLFKTMIIRLTIPLQDYTNSQFPIFMNVFKKMWQCSREFWTCTAVLWFDWWAKFKVFYRKFVRRYDSAMEREQMSWVLVNFYQFRIKIKNRYVMFGGTIPSFPVLVLVSDQAEQMGTVGIFPNPVLAENKPD